MPTNGELAHPPINSDDQLPANQEISNEYHISYPGKPVTALGEALKDDMGLDIIIAIIADPRCGLERRSAFSDGYLTFSSSQMSSWGKFSYTLPRPYGTDSYTPLFLAVIYCRVDVVRALLEGSTMLAMAADVNVIDERGRTPLHLAVLYGHTACAELLISKGVNVHAADKETQTPLHVAVLRGRTAFAELLIAKGTDVNAADWKGNTPLHIATLRGHIACAELLIATGAHVNVIDYEGRTPLHVATRSYGNTAFAELLISKGGDVNAGDGERTPLHDAAENGNVPFAELLIDEGADANAVDYKGRTPLHLAAEYRHTACTERLIARGAV